MSTGNDETATLAEPRSATTFVSLLPRSVVLGALMALVAGILLVICLSVFGWLESFRMPTFWGFTPLDLVRFAVAWMAAALPGAISGVFVAALLRLFVRLRIRKGFAGALAGTIVGLFFSILFFLLYVGFYAQTGDVPSPLQTVSMLAFVLVLPITMGTTHGLLLARWGYGEGSREQKLRWSLITAGYIAAFFLVFAIALGIAAGLQTHRRIQTRREEAAISPEVARDVCVKLALSPQDSRCREGANVRAYDFFPEIRMLANRGMTLEQIDALFGAYKVSCGTTLHKTVGDEGYFVCSYDLKGNGTYWFAFEFTTGGALTRVSTSSAPPPP